METCFLIVFLSLYLCYVNVIKNTSALRTFVMLGRLLSMRFYATHAAITDARLITSGGK